MLHSFTTYESTLVRIATPRALGNGFFRAKERVVITNEHLVSNAKEVVIQSQQLPRTISKVWLTDPIADLAILSVPEHFVPEALPWAKPLQEQADLSVVGWSARDESEVLPTQLMNKDYSLSKIDYLRLKDAIPAELSGAPVLNQHAAVAGMAVFIPQIEGLGLALPTTYITQVLEAYQPYWGQTATRCVQCRALVFEQTIEDEGYCPDCGTPVKLPSDNELYKPLGVAELIEQIIEGTGHNVKLSRRGAQLWEVQQGSARVQISYDHKTGYLLGDAILCALPEGDCSELYAFLLQENHAEEGLNFSLHDDKIALTLMIYDRFLNVETGTRLFRILFQKADRYDDLLVQRFGAKWIYASESSDSKE